MKLVKFIPAIGASLVLAACSTVGDVASGAANAVGNVASAAGNAVSSTASAVGNTVTSGASAVGNAVTGAASTTTVPTTSKAIVYSCSNRKTVTATYAFEGEKAKAVNLIIGKTKINALLRDDNAKDAATFASDAFSWSVDENFSLTNFDKTDSGILFKKGANSDEILAKLCKVNKSATKKANG